MTDNSYDDNNIFAKIIKGEAKATIVYENKNIICFEDIFPKASVHILIIPKGKYVDFNDFSLNSNAEEKLAVFDGLSRIIEMYKLQKNGYRIISNAGKNGRQEIPHLHFHLLGGNDIGSMLA